MTHYIDVLIEEQASLFPSKIAVVCDDQCLSYRELDQRSNQLARHLRGLGVGPDSVVGVCLKRSTELIIGILGILKAGGAYLPLDPNYPTERLSFMIDDSQISLLLTQKHVLPGIPVEGVQAINLDTDWPSIAVHSCLPVDRKHTSENLAYIIYTSGSTGKPKGVMIPHSGAVNYLLWAISAYEVATGSGALVHSSIAFDLTVTSLFAPLLVGQRAILVTEDQGIEALRHFLEREQQLSFVKLTPSHLELLNRMVPAASIKDRTRCLIIGGEALMGEHVMFWRTHSPSTRFINEYGPTETVVGCCVYEVPATEIPSGPLPIGRPVAQTSLYILDESLQPVLPGVAGELYIGGVQVGRGYLNRPDVTAERFLPDPVSQSPGSRMYRTGDLARSGPDGILEYLGRIDHQIKLRGFRIEPGEIETALLAHPAVQQSVVVLREDAQGESYLVAYVVLSDQQTITVSEARSLLRKTLPDYMIPAVFVFLDALPLTPNGKVDRVALPTPEQVHPSALELERRASNPVEEALLHIWRELLPARQIGVSDHFLDLGGHSLLATRLISRIFQIFHVALPLRQIFETPTIESLAAALAQHEHCNIELAGTSFQDSRLTILPRAKGTQTPLSFAQQRLWFLDQLEPDSAIYNTFAMYRFTGRLVVPAVRRCLDEMARRHEILRTAFVHEGNQEVLQVIASEVALPLVEVDLTHYSPVEREQRLRELTDREVQQPFHLTQGPLLRAMLVRLEQEQAVLLVSMHHIISDGWSYTIFQREFQVLYAAFCQDQPSPLPDLPIQYADFALWQQQWLQTEDRERQLLYWSAQLAGLPVLELPTDYPRPAIQTYRGQHAFFTLLRPLCDKLKLVGRNEEATLFMTVLAAFQVLLFRYTGQQDIAVGSPIANRVHAELEGLIGFFVNTLVLRARLSGSMNFAELLAQVRQTTLDAYAHQDLPFEKLVDFLSPERTLSHTPLFQVLFALEHETEMEIRSPEMNEQSARDVWRADRNIQAENARTRCDLSISLREEAGNLLGVLEYNTDLFEATTIARCIQHFLRLLEQIAADPYQSLQMFDLLTLEEKNELLLTWNATQRSFAEPSVSLTQLIEEQVKQRPDALAVIFEDQQITYQTLDIQANRVAQGLSRMHIAPEMLVGICIEPSLEMVIGMVGILKAGAGYVPLDPNYPEERLAYIIQDAHLSLLLTLRDSGVLPDVETPQVFLEDFLREIPNTVVAPGCQVTAGNLAYVVYTSGSTGQPKGVQINHRGLLNLVYWHQQAYNVRPSDRATQVASMAFDACVWEIWPYLASGASLHICNREDRQFPEALRDWLLRQQITICFLPTPLAEKVLDLAWPATADLRLLLTGGDILYRYPSKALPFTLVNHYGPTEATVVASAGIVEESTEGRHTPPIGRPIANTRIYVLDEALQLVPVGVPGELCIAGTGLARGYLLRPDLTAERFIPNPLSKESGERLYKTGDRVRYLKDGAIEFLGRVDNQVKLRGFRIELGEIEMSLTLHPAIREAVVLLQGEGEKQLVAYLVLHAQSTLSKRDVRAFLQKRLPAYMLPSAFVFLEAIPLTSHGKIDRRALPSPEWETYDSEVKTPIEEILMNIWSEVLGIEHIGSNDNFFEIGGHSLLATQVLSRIRQVFAIDLPLRAIFEMQTIALLAGRITAEKRETRNILLPPLQPLPDCLEPPLSFGQQRLWFLNQLVPDHPFYNVPLALHLDGPLQVSVLEQCFNEIVRRHEMLRTTFHSKDGSQTQMISPSLSLKCLLLDLSHLPASKQEEEVHRLAFEEARRPFNLERGPLLRIRVICLEPERYILLLTLHHIVADAWSMEILGREVAALYPAFAARQPSPLPDLPLQYKDYAIWQRRWLQGDLLATQLAYWTEKLREAELVLDLPFDYARPAQQTYWGATHYFSLPLALKNELEKLSNRQGVTLFITLLATFQVLLYRYTRQEDIVIGMPVANRAEVDLEELIGFFVNTLALRVQVSPGQTFLAFLEQVREVALEAYIYQDLPFEKLVEELHPERDLSRSPIFQVLFAYQHTQPFQVTLDRLSIRSGEVDGGISLFDITLIVTKTESGLRCALTYNTDLFKAETIQRMADHYHTLLQAIVEDATARIADLPLLTEDERCKLLVTWNASSSDALSSHCVHQILEEQVERTPEAIAVVFEEQALSYRELNYRATRLAQYLRRQGIGPDRRVGVYMPRSLEQIISVVGILKAGGAYVPLDPSYPAERLTFMLEDADIQILLTQEHIQTNISGFTGMLVSPQLAMEHETLECDEVVKSEVDGSNLAYVIYTSGSTGRPKGVAMPHRPLVNLLAWQSQQAHLSQAARTLQFASLSFDVSFQEMFSTWSTGGTLFLISEQLRRDFLGLLNLLEYQAIERLFLPFVALRSLAEMANLHQVKLTHLQDICTAGEQLQIQQTLSEFFTQRKHCRLHNHYGPSESHVVTSHTLGDLVQHWPSLPPIGYPIANTQIYLLDASMHLVPIGLSGELYIGGECLAREYLNRPDLTAERFVPNPFGTPGTRLYKTGDLARFTGNGSLEFLGRGDQQVKVRGYRIEPGEIEAMILQHPSVRQGVVVVQEDGQNEKAIIAYVSCHDGAALAQADLRRFLLDRLPEYMVPSFIMLLDTFPLTPSGKVNRRALPPVENARKVIGAEYVAPSTPIEEMLVQLWQDLLKLEQVGIHDNFFDLGGHSLLIIQMHSRLKTLFENPVSIIDLFTYPTIATLAAYIAQQKQTLQLPEKGYSRAERRKNARLQRAEKSSV